MDVNVLQKCCFRSLKENRKRTAVTIVGIILATSLITAVACMAASFRASMTQHARQETGDFHYLFSGVTPENMKYFQNNQNVDRLGLSQEVGYALLPECQNPNKPYLYVRAVDDTCLDMFYLKLCEGRLPEDDTELLMSRHIRSNGGVHLKGGDVLTLPVGSRVSEGYELTQYNPYEERECLETDSVRTYTVVGMVERPSYQVEDREAPGYSVFTRLSQATPGEALDVYVSYTRKALKEADRVTAGLLGITLKEYGQYESGKYSLQGATAASVLKNYRLLRWEFMHFSSTTMNMLYSMAGVAIFLIVVSSVFCIRNSFMISLTEKMKLYGRLASVGTTRRQQRKIVYYEAGFLGLVGIPLGVFCGVLAEFVLVCLVGGLVEDAIGFPLVFAFSLPAVVLGAVLSMATVFFSAYGSARRAARVSPLSAIRANDTIRISQRSVKCPRWVGWLFGIGGKVAYKSLGRARVRYRTTVMSIVVSVAVFIGVSAFVQVASLAGRVYQENTACSLVISIEDEDWRSIAGRVAALEGVQEMEVRRTAYFTVDRDSIPYTREYLEHYGIGEEEGDQIFLITSLGEAGYARYLKQAGIRQEDAADKAILANNFEVFFEADGKRHVADGKITEYQAGDIVRDKESERELEILGQTAVRPMFMGTGYYNNVMLIVSDAWMDAHEDVDQSDNVVLYIKCRDASQIEETVRQDMGLLRYTVTNYEAAYQSERSTLLVVSVFLYGFITVVSLIGVTNIFNTVTTNMELRAPEFAVLKSVGMTDREFKRMIWLEGLFYGGKALLVAIPLGLGLAYWIHMAFGEGVVAAFRPPVWAVFVAVAAVFVLLSGILWYSCGKVKRRNLMETIQNENI